VRNNCENESPTSGSFQGNLNDKKTSDACQSKSPSTRRLVTASWMMCL